MTTGDAPAVLLARRYLAALQAHDGRTASSLFITDGVLDDGNGGHHRGADAITAFIDSLTANVVVDEAAVVANAERVTVYGTVGSDTLEPSLFRWVFHFSDGRITHLGNSYLRAFPDIASPDLTK